jgi:myo-inositol 2-dehydrogenase/D-chiro-inositol 1-dehydrogenase
LTTGASGLSSTTLRDPAIRRPHATITETLADSSTTRCSTVGTEVLIHSRVGHFDHLHPAFELRVDRREKGGVETVRVGPSGELAELSEQARQVVPAFTRRRPLLSGEEARKRIVVCLAAEQSLLEGREIALRF